MNAAPANSDWLAERLRARSGSPAQLVLPGGRELDGAALVTEAERLETVWRQAGVVAAEAIALPTMEPEAFVAGLLAVRRLRAVAVPLALGSTHGAENVERQTTGRCSWLAEGGQQEGLLRLPHGDLPADRPPPWQQLAERGAPGLMLFSSGSTGTPKSLLHDLEALLAVHRPRRAHRMGILHFLLLDHIGGLNTLFGALATGAPLIFAPARDPETIAATIAATGAEILPTTPSFLNLLLLCEAPQRHDLSSLRLITYGTEAMPEALLVRLRQAFPKVRFVQTFGTSETGIAPTQSKESGSTLLKLGGDGFAYRLVAGELWLKGPSTMLGYLNQPASGTLTDDGWFRTGDLAEETSDGYLRILGRVREVINVGGQKVLPSEVENALLTSPEVLDCLVRAAPHPLLGQVVEALVEWRGPDGRPALPPPTEAAAWRRRLRQHCQHLLNAPFKVPTQWTFVAELPVSARGKKLRGG